jgi:uncharacterized protein YkwD
MSKMFIISLSLILLLAVPYFSYIFSSANVSGSGVEPVTLNDLNIDEDVLWDEVQEWRKTNNLPLYQKSELTCRVATERLADTRKPGGWSHNGFNAERWCKTDCVLSENISLDDNPLEGWLNSPPHAAALRENYPYSCIKCEGTYCVHIFSY